MAKRNDKKGSKQQGQQPKQPQWVQSEPKLKSQNVARPAGGLFTDVSAIDQPKNTYRYALNAIKETQKGDRNFVSNEQSNFHCDTLSDTHIIMGEKYMSKDKTVILSVSLDETISEIGIMDQDCNYTPYVRSNNLGFKLTNQIDIVYRLRRGCERTIYFTDGGIPIAYFVFEDADEFKVENWETLPEEEWWDPNKFKLIRGYDSVPCIDVDVIQGGAIFSGSYNFAIQYLDEDLNPTNWILTTQTINIFVANENGGYEDIVGSQGEGTTLQQDFFGTGKASKSIRLTTTNLDLAYPFYRLGIIKAIAGTGDVSSIVATPEISTKLSEFTYSGNETGYTQLTLEEIAQPKIDLETAEHLEQIENRLVPANTKGKAVNWCNFQRFASKIDTKYTVKQIPTIDLVDGNPKTGTTPYYSQGYQAGEVYAAAIVYVFADGTESPAFHIPGRPSSEALIEAYPGSIPLNYNFDKEKIFPWTQNLSPYYNTETEYASLDPNDRIERWQVFDTAIEAKENLAENAMAYWQTNATLYPDLKNCGSPLDYWGTDYYGLDLVNTPIRHHKFPSRQLEPLVQLKTANGEQTIVEIRQLYLNIDFNTSNGGGPAGPKYYCDSGTAVGPPGTQVTEGTYPFICLCDTGGPTVPEGARVCQEDVDTITFEITYSKNGIPYSYIGSISATSSFPQSIYLDDWQPGETPADILAGPPVPTFNWTSTPPAGMAGVYDDWFTYAFSDEPETEVRDSDTVANILGFDFSNVEYPRDDIIGHYFVVAERNESNRLVWDNGFANILRGNENYITYSWFTNTNFLPYTKDTFTAPEADPNLVAEPTFVYVNSPKVLFAGESAQATYLSIEGHFNISNTNNFIKAKKTDLYQDVANGTTSKGIFGFIKTDKDGLSWILGYRWVDYQYSRVTPEIFNYAINKSVTLAPAERRFSFDNSGTGDRVLYNTTLDSRTAIYDISAVEPITPIGGNNPYFPPGTAIAINPQTTSINDIYSLKYVSLKTIQDVHPFLDVIKYRRTHSCMLSAFNGQGDPDPSIAYNIYGGDVYTSGIGLTQSTFYETAVPKRWGEIISSIFGLVALAVATVFTAGTAAVALGASAAAVVTTIALASAFGISSLLVSQFMKDLEEGGLRKLVYDSVMRAGISNKGDNDDLLRYMGEHNSGLYWESEINTALRQETTLDCTSFVKESKGRVLRDYFKNKYLYLEPERDNVESLKPLPCPEVYKANIDYERQNLEKIYFPLSSLYDCCSECREEHPNRIYYSEQAFQEELSDNYQIYLPNNFRDVEAEHGEITDVIRRGNELLYHTREAFWFLPQNIQERVTGDVISFLGTGEYFSIPPRKIGDDEQGSAGTQHKWASIKTKHGLFFVTENEATIYLYTDKPAPISYIGNKSWFKNYIPLKAALDYQNATGREFPFVNNPSNPVGVGFISAYDSRYERFIVTKKDYSLADALPENCIEGESIINDPQFLLPIINPPTPGLYGWYTPDIDSGELIQDGNNPQNFIALDQNIQFSQLIPDLNAPVGNYVFRYEFEVTNWTQQELIDNWGSIRVNASGFDNLDNPGQAFFYLDSNPAGDAIFSGEVRIRKSGDWGGGASQFSMNLYMQPPFPIPFTNFTFEIRNLDIVQEECDVITDYEVCSKGGDLYYYPNYEQTIADQEALGYTFIGVTDDCKLEFQIVSGYDEVEICETAIINIPSDADIITTIDSSGSFTDDQLINVEQAVANLYSQINLLVPNYSGTTYSSQDSDERWLRWFSEHADTVYGPPPYTGRSAIMICFVNESTGVYTPFSVNTNFSQYSSPSVNYDGDENAFRFTVSTFETFIGIVYPVVCNPNNPIGTTCGGGGGYNETARFLLQTFAGIKGRTFTSLEWNDVLVNPAINVGDWTTFGNTLQTSNPFFPARPAIGAIDTLEELGWTLQPNRYNDQGIVITNQQFIDDIIALIADKTEEIEVCFPTQVPIIETLYLPFELVENPTAIDTSWTISFDITAGSWTSWHSYLPYRYISIPDNFYSFIHGSDNIWKHNAENSYQIFYDELRPHVLEYVSLSNPITTRIWSFLTLETSALSFQNGAGIDERFITFNKAILYNTRQSSGEINLVVDQKDQANMLQVAVTDNLTTQRLIREERNWRINDIRDLITDTTVPMFLSDYISIQPAYFTDKVVNPFAFTPKDWTQLESFRDKYLIIRLTFDNFSNIQLTTNYTIETESASYR